MDHIAHLKTVPIIKYIVRNNNRLADESRPKTRINGVSTRDRSHNEVIRHAHLLSGNKVGNSVRTNELTVL